MRKKQSSKAAYRNEQVVPAPRVVEYAESNETSTGPRRTDERAGTGQRLLVVDDDAAMRELACELLGAEGYHVMTAEDGIDALRLIDEFTPDLVITDLRMPRMSGAELLGILRARLPQLPLIAISGDVDGEASLPGVTADAVFSKGDFITPRFRTAIAELLAKAAQRDGKSGAEKNGSEGIVSESKGFHGVADMRAVLGRLAQTIRPAAALSLSPAAGVDKGNEAPRAALCSAFSTSFD